MDEFFSICDQVVLAEAESQYVCYIIILLAVVAALPINIRSQRGRREVNGDIQVFHSLDGFVSVEHLVRELGVKRIAVVC